MIRVFLKFYERYMRNRENNCMAVDCAAAYGYNISRVEIMHKTHENPVKVRALRGFFVGLVALRGAYPATDRGSAILRLP